jgi:putative copper resistance protein D
VQAVIESGINAMMLATALLNLGFALLLGAVLTSWQTGVHTSAWSRQRHRQLRGLIFFSIAVMLAAMVAVLLVEAATMAEVPLQESAQSVWPVLSSTHFGRAWIAGVGCIVLVLLLQLQGAVSPHRYLASALAIGGFAVSRSAVSHAIVAGAASWPVAVETAHLLLISVWLGEVVIAGLFMLRVPCGPNSDDRRDCGSYVAQLSTSATAALIGIVITGALNSWRGLGDLQHLLDNAWGVILLVKLTGVAIAVALGALNRWQAMPALLLDLQSSSLVSVPAQRRFALVLQVESVVLMAVLLAAAILSSTTPPVTL